MLASTRIALIAGAALLLAMTGCKLEALETADALRPVAAAMETPPLGHELLRMVTAGNPQAGCADLPARF
jgi:hypothetical protein